jgi:hypothetical protein
MEDVHAVQDAIDMKSFDERALTALSAIESESDDDDDDDAGHEEREAEPPRSLSRKLFGKLATWRRVAAANGCDLVKIRVALARCVDCGRSRVVDARSSAAARAKFVCGGAMQVRSFDSRR